MNASQFLPLEKGSRQTCKRVHRGQSRRCCGRHIFKDGLQRTLLHNPTDLLLDISSGGGWVVNGWAGHFFSNFCEVLRERDMCPTMETVTKSYGPIEKNVIPHRFLSWEARPFALGPFQFPSPQKNQKQTKSVRIHTEDSIQGAPKLTIRCTSLSIQKGTGTRVIPKKNIGPFLIGGKKKLLWLKFKF